MAFFVEIVALLGALGVGVISAIRLGHPVAVSPWLFPLIVSSAIAMVSIALLVGEVRGRLRARAQPSETDTFPLLPRSTPARVVGWLALSGGYGIATPLIGFEWATTIFLPVALRTFSGASWVWTISLTAGMALVLPLVFRYWFQSLVP